MEACKGVVISLAQDTRHHSKGFIQSVLQFRLDIQNIYNSIASTQSPAQNLGPPANGRKRETTFCDKARRLLSGRSHYPFRRTRRVIPGRRMPILPSRGFAAQASTARRQVRACSDTPFAAAPAKPMDPRARA